MAKDAAYWRSRRECGPILRHLLRSSEWLGGRELSKALSKRSAPIFQSLAELMNAGLIEDKQVSLEGAPVPFRKYQLTQKGRSVARLLDT